MDDVLKIMMFSYKNGLKIFTLTWKVSMGSLKLVGKCLGLVGKGVGKGVDVYQSREVTQGKKVGLKRKEQDLIDRLFKNSGLSEPTNRGWLVPEVYKYKNGEIHIDILPSQKPEQIESVLRGLGDIFQKDFVTIEKITRSSFRLVEDLLPDFIDYEDRPEGEGLWLGRDYFGKDIFLDFGNSPVMLIAGESGSGKSVETRVLCQEAHRANFKIYVTDGKGAADYYNTPREKVFIELEEVAEHYEDMVSLMKERLKMNADNQCKNWYELREKGFDIEPILLVMDEASDYFEIVPKGQNKTAYELGHRIVNALSELARKSRAAGIFQCFILQAADAEGIPTYVRRNIGFKIGYNLGSMSQSMFKSSIADDNSLINGKGVYQAKGSPVLFKGPYIDESNYSYPEEFSKIAKGEENEQTN